MTYNIGICANIITLSFEKISNLTSESYNIGEGGENFNIVRGVGNLIKSIILFNIYIQGVPE